MRLGFEHTYASLPPQFFVPRHRQHGSQSRSCRLTRDDRRITELVRLLQLWEQLEHKRGLPGFDPWAVHAVRHDIREMVEACQREGAVAAGMTGSGSAVFGLFSQAAASRAARRLRRPDWLVLIARTLTRREARRRISL